MEEQKKMKKEIEKINCEAEFILDGKYWILGNGREKFFLSKKDVIMLSKLQKVYEKFEFSSAKIILDNEKS